VNREAFIAAVFAGDVETAQRLKDEAVRELYSQPDFNPAVRAHLAKCLEKAEAKVGRRPPCSPSWSAWASPGRPGLTRPSIRDRAE
jgi:hypothetical protein